MSKKKMKTKLLLALMLWLCQGELRAQQTANSGGGEAQGSAGKVSYTLGQATFSTYTSEAGSVAEGVHQPFEISVVSSAQGYESITLTCNVYPNPTTNFLTLSVDQGKGALCHAILLDMNGRTLSRIKVEGSETVIAMQGYAPAVYLLRVACGGKTVKTFRIVKQ